MFPVMMESIQQNDVGSYTKNVFIFHNKDHTRSVCQKKAKFKLRRVIQTNQF